MIIVTGAAGFIGSCLVSKLNKEGIIDIIVVDDFSDNEKNKNLLGKNYLQQVHRNNFIDWFKDNYNIVNFVYHIGARTDTTEFNKEIFDKLNLNFTKDVWRLCAKHFIPMVYASSAATYGLGEHGYTDSHEIIPQLKPLNPYGDSKNDFDKWAIAQQTAPPFWAGLKFFNVYGPNEYHKLRMASVVFHAYNQIKEKGSVKLFKSHNADYKDGEQLRDFIYIKDLINVCFFLYQQKTASGIYNLGTGKARTFVDLVNAVFVSINKKPEINFIDTPADIRDKYQYFTEANMTKLISAGYNSPFTSLETGVKDYVTEYLVKNIFY
jgi:ADP-L-glycero-D-manno-heptose 6-epimerase